MWHVSELLSLKFFSISMEYMGSQKLNPKGMVSKVGVSSLSFCLSALFLFLSVPLSLTDASAQSSEIGSSKSIYNPRGLEGRVEFWKLIFARYGKDHRVFHNRKYPEIIYSVIDFSEYEASLRGKALMDAKLREVDKEKAKIISALLHLASGNKARNDFESRIDQLYSGLKGNKRSLMREGAKEELIRYQTGIKERFRDGLVRSGRYLKAIEHIFVSEGLPPELGRLPLVESSFDYTAYSSVGAAGIWQFMPATAKRYMTMNNYLDERRDPIIATRAAAKYLKNSYKNTGEWPLAVTSYNHGLSGVMRGVKQVGSINLVDLIEKYDAKSFGFASSNFYAEFIAALEVERNSEKYFPGLERERAIEFDEVRVAKSVRYSDLLTITRASNDQLVELNRGFKPPILTGRVSIPAGTLVKVPRDTGSKLIAKVSGSQIVARSTNFKAHLYKPGTSTQLASSIPESVSMEVLEERKDVRQVEVIPLGEELRAPSKSRSSTQIAKNTNAVLKPITYKVKPGDTLSGLARTFNLPVKEIMSLNGFTKANDLKFGKEIKISSSGTKRSVTTDTVKPVSSSYVVKRGDTLSGISKKFSRPVKDIMRVNGLKSANDLKAGKSIKIPT